MDVYENMSNKLVSSRKTLEMNNIYIINDSVFFSEMEGVDTFLRIFNWFIKLLCKVWL